MEIDALLARQRAYFESGRTLSVDFRLSMLKKLKKAVQDNEEQIIAALREDLNKAEQESFMTELGMVYDELSFALKHTAAWARRKHVKTPISQFPSRSFVVREPYGVALIMSPWNYPFLLCIAPVIGAIAAGNCAIVKPSAYALHTSRRIAELIGAAFPSEYIAVVEGGREANQALLEQKFDYIFFTGSVSVGRHVMECASKHLTPVSLELGGKSPVIVDASANLALSAKRIAFGKCLNAGQTCVAPDYVLAHASIKDALIEELQKAMTAFFPSGDYSSMPVIVNDRHFARVMGLIDPAKVVCGGKGDPQRRFIEPTLLKDVEWNDAVMREEIFGPALPVLSYEELDEAIKCINARPKPLALYLFTSDQATEKKVLDSVPFGGGCINDTIVHTASPYLAFGGVGEGGMGSYHGKKSFDTFTHEKSILKKSALIDMKPRYQPYTQQKQRLVRLLLK